MKSLIKLSASLKLAVITILSIGVLTAIGTIVESQYDAYAAKKWIYDTPWMYGVMGLLALNLISVMVDRWPWKRRHISFVCAHIGILLMLLGAVITMNFGLDGTMRVGIGEQNNLVTTGDTDVLVYSSFDGDRYSKTLEKEVDFFLHPPTAEKPFVIPTMNKSEIKIVDYNKYVIPSRKVIASDSPKSGAGLRFQVQNANVNVIEWLVQKKAGQEAIHNFGPAQVHLGPAPIHGNNKNEIYLEPKKDSLAYTVFHKDTLKPFKKGVAKEGDVFEPGWMGIQFRVLRYFPLAQEDWDLQKLEHPTPLTTPAVKVIFNGKEQWLLMNDMVKLFTDDAVYLVGYTNRRIDIGFPVKLINFDVGHYQGTTRASEYASLVEVPGVGQKIISMNEPLNWKGLTVYQASFQEADGKPTASIFSINRDPGRWLKYLGALVMVFGIICMFYFKHMDFLAQKKQAPKRPEVS